MKYGFLPCVTGRYTVPSSRYPVLLRTFFMGDARAAYGQSERSVKKCWVATAGDCTFIVTVIEIWFEKSRVNMRGRQKFIENGKPVVRCKAAATRGVPRRARHTMDHLILHS